MIISSKINESKWIWIKIPKTGSRAYSKLLVPDGEDELIQNENRLFHFHFTFSHLYTHHQKKYTGFTVVRHPVTRFISALNHLADLNFQCVTPNCINHPGKLPLNSIDSLVEFVYDNFHKNCLPKNNASFNEVFGVDFTNFYDSFFKTQTFWAYHPKMKWFFYEELDTFNNWLQATLGVDAKHIERVGEIKKKHLEHLDFNSPKFIKMVEYLFYDDYKIYGYTPKYMG